MYLRSGGQSNRQKKVQMFFSNMNETILVQSLLSLWLHWIAYVTNKTITPVLCMNMKHTLVLEIRDRNSHSKRIHK